MASVPVAHHPANTGAPAQVHAKPVPGRVLALAVLIYVALLPSQFAFAVGGVVLFPYRLLLLGGIVAVVLGVIRGDIRWRLADTLVVAFALWMIIALMNTMDAATAIQGGGAQFVDIVISYLCGRLAIRSPRDFRAFLILIAPGVAIIGGLMALESFSHTLIIQPLASSITGRPVSVGFVERLGLLRAPGPFPHPLLGGVFLGSFLALYALSGIRGWPRLAGIFASVCCLFSISSVAILAMVSSSGLLIYNWLTEKIANLSWRLFLLGGAVLVFVLELATKSGSFSILVRYASLNSTSAYNRILIWNFGSRSVKNNLLFGVGYNDWERPIWMRESIDNYWLLTAIQFGLLPALLLLIVSVMAVARLGRNASRSTRLDRALLIGTAIAFAIFALGIVSVAIWQSALVWFYMLLGISISLGGRAGLPNQPIPPAVQEHR